MNTGGHREMNDNENPFAFNTETGGGRSNSHSTFTFFADNPTEDVPARTPARAGNVDQNVLNSKSIFKLQRWNTVLRLATFILTLVAVLFMVVARQTSSELAVDGVSAKASYHISGSFVFFLYVNIVVMAYMLALSICAIVMGRKGEGRTTPASMMRPALVLNLVHGTALIIAFSVALAVVVVSKNGIYLGNVHWEPICRYFKTFCADIEVALAACAAAYLCLVASTAIDAYYIHLFS